MTEIKICGMVCEEDIDLVNEAGPDYVGFILYVSKSKRNLSIEEARRLAGRVRPGISRVAVTISPGPDQIRNWRTGTVLISCRFTAVSGRTFTKWSVFL